MGYFIKLFISIVAIISISMVSAQQMYRWVDASGQVHYTDNPAIAKKHNAKAMAKPTASRVQSDTSLTDEQRAEKELQRANLTQLQQKNAERQQILQEHCTKLAEELDFIKNGTRGITDGKNPDGSYRILNDKEREQFIANKEAVYRKTCGR